MKHSIDLNALREFHLVVSHGGFGAAARISGEPKATLSRHIRALEDSLGLRLIDRDSRAFRLTDEGSLLRARTENLLAELTDITSSLAHDRGAPQGKLRVSSPLMFGHLAMGALAANFARRYPGIQLEVTVEDRHVDLIEEGYDVAIRINPRPDSQLIGRCFHRDSLLLVASAQVQRSGDPETPLPFIAGSSAPEVQKRSVLRGNEEQHFTLKTILRLPSPLIIRDALLTGTGVGILPEMLVIDQIKSGQLQNWGRLPDGDIELWALHASKRLASRRVKAFIDFMAEEMPGFLRGGLPQS